MNGPRSCDAPQPYLTARPAIVAMLDSRRRGYCAVADRPAPSAAQSAQPRRHPSRGLTELSQSLQDLAERVSPSVVQVFVTGYAEPDEDDQAASEPVLERSSGSGVIVDPDGYIITNAHVIERATRIEVELSLAATGRCAGRVGPAAARPHRRRADRRDRSRDRHCRREGRSAKGLPVLPFGDSEALRPGQIVLAFGSPLGLESSVTLGRGQRRGATAHAGGSDDLHPDRRAHQSGQQRRGARRYRGAPGRHQHAHLLAVGRQRGDRLRRAEQHRHATSSRRFARPGACAAARSASHADDHAAPGRGAGRHVRCRRRVVRRVAWRARPRVPDCSPGDLVLALDGKRMENGRQLRINLLCARRQRDGVARGPARRSKAEPVKVPVGERDSDVGRLSDLVAQQIPVRALGVLWLNLTPQIARALAQAAPRQKGVVVASVSSVGARTRSRAACSRATCIYSLNGKVVETVADLNTVAERLQARHRRGAALERSGTLMFHCVQWCETVGSQVVSESRACLGCSRFGALDCDWTDVFRLRLPID